MGQPDPGIWPVCRQQPVAGQPLGSGEGRSGPLQFHYQAGGKTLVNNGHTVQVNYAPGSTLELDGMHFELKQFHFHAPSENLIEGKSYPWRVTWSMPMTRGSWRWSP